MNIEPVCGVPIEVLERLGGKSHTLGPEDIIG